LRKYRNIETKIIRLKEKGTKRKAIQSLTTKKLLNDTLFIPKLLDSVVSE